MAAPSPLHPGGGAGPIPSSWKRRLTSVAVVVGLIGLLLAAAVVVLWPRAPQIMGQCGGLECSGGIALGNVRAGTCSATRVETLASSGCVSGGTAPTSHFVENLTVEQSTATLGDVAFEVIVVSTGQAFLCPEDGGGCGLSVVNWTGGVVGYFALAAGGAMGLNDSFSYNPAVGNGTALAPGYGVIVDLGTTSTEGMGLGFVARGPGGWTSVVSLI